MATGGRKTQYQAIHQISVEVKPGLPPVGVIGVLPAGAILNSCHVLTQAPFNATTSTVAVGTTPGGAELVTARDQQVVARNDTVCTIGSGWTDFRGGYADLLPTGG